MATTIKNPLGWKIRAVAAPGLLLLLLAGCATLPSPEGRQQVSVVTALPDGTAVTGALCDVKNDKGAWSTVTPGSVQVLQSDSPLQVTCQKNGYQAGSTLAGKPVEGYVLGEMGGLGKLVIGGSSAARPAHMNQGAEVSKKFYVDSITVTLKRLEADTSSVKSGTPAIPPRSDITPLNLDDAQKKCAEIGFVKGTENFGLCVMQLMR